MVAGVLSAVATSAAIAWPCRRSRGAARRSATTDVLELRYAPVLGIVVAGIALLFLALLVAVMIYEPPSLADLWSDKWFPPLVFAGFAALSAAGFVELVTLRVEVSTYGVRVCSPWTGQRQLAWHEIAEIRYAPAMMWFVLRGGNGMRLRVSKGLRGIPELGREVRARLEPSVFADADLHFDTPLGY